MITAAIFPTGPLTDETVDSIVSKALAAGLVPCNLQGGKRFRLGFFPADRIPSNWKRCGLGINPTKDTPPCAA